MNMMTLQELSERVKRLEREVAELKALVKPKPQPTSVTPEDLERRRKAVEALLAFRESLCDKLKGVTLTDILTEMRYGRIVCRAQALPCAEKTIF